MNQPLDDDSLSGLIPQIIYVDDETFDQMLHDLDNPQGPSETIRNGAKLLKALYDHKRHGKIGAARKVQRNGK